MSDFLIIAAAVGLAWVAWGGIGRPLARIEENLTQADLTESENG